MQSLCIRQMLQETILSTRANASLTKLLVFCQNHAYAAASEPCHVWCSKGPQVHSQTLHAATCLDGNSTRPSLKVPTQFDIFVFVFVSCSKLINRDTRSQNKCYFLNSAWFCVTSCHRNEHVYKCSHNLLLLFSVDSSSSKSMMKKKRPKFQSGKNT